MLESEFSDKVVDGLRKRQWKVQPIESPITGAGIPDLYATKLHPPGEHALWLELKVRGRGRKEKYRPGQLPWLEDNVQHGGISVTLIYDNDEHRIYCEHFKRNGTRAMCSFIDRSGVMDYLDAWLLTL